MPQFVTFLSYIAVFLFCHTLNHKEDDFGVRDICCNVSSRAIKTFLLSCSWLHNIDISVLPGVIFSLHLC